MSDFLSSSDELSNLLHQVHELRYVDIHKMRQLVRQALVLAEQLADVESQIRCLNYLAWVCNRADRYNEALKHAQRALLLAIEHGYTRHQGYAHINLSLTYAVIGQPLRSVQAAEDAYRIALEVQDYELVALALNDKAIAYVEGGQLELALELLEQSLKMIEAEDLAVPISYPLSNMAMLHLEQDRPDVAYGLIQQMLDDPWGAHHRVFNLYVLMAYHQHQGDLELAYQTAQQAIETATALQLDQVLAYMMRGKVERELGKWDDALHSLNHAMHIAQQQQHYESMIRLHELLASLYEDQGDYQQALHHSRALSQQQSLLMEQTIETRLYMMQTRYEHEANQQQEKILALKNEMLQAELREQRRFVMQQLEQQRKDISFEKDQELHVIKTQILTRLGHEFRTPLAVIQSSMDLLTHYGDRLSEERKQLHTDKIYEQIRNLETLINNSLSTLRSLELVTGDRIPPGAPLALRELQERIEQQFLETERTHLELDPDQMVDSFDPEILWQIVKQVVGNALKFSQGRVHVTMQVQEDVFRLCVKDEGIGIHPDDHSRLYVPMRRGRNAIHTRGIGMGLAIVYNYIQLLKGSITIESELNVGTEVCIVLPLHTPATAL